MHESIFGRVEASIQDYLSTVTAKAGTDPDPAAAELARAEIPRLVAALRGLLEDHQPDADGRCPTCRTRLFTRAPSPCRAYLTANLCLMMADDATSFAR